MQKEHMKSLQNFGYARFSTRVKKPDLELDLLRTMTASGIQNAVRFRSRKL